MNLVDVEIIEVVVKIHKIDEKLYSKTVLTDCYGIKEEKIINGSWNYVRKHKVGYKWLE
jgi:hypothetical protein